MHKVRSLSLAALFVLIPLSYTPGHSQTVEATALKQADPQSIVRMFREGLSDYLPGEAPPVQKAQSEDKEFGTRSALLIEKAAKKKLTFSAFSYVAYSFGEKTPDRWASLYVFKTGDPEKASRFAEGLPNASDTTPGLLPTKAPQQFKVLVLQDMLCVLVVEQWQADTVSTALFEAFRHLDRRDVPAVPKSEGATRQ